MEYLDLASISVAVFRVIFRNWKFTDAAIVLCAFQQDPYIASMEHHTDWVNDIVLCCNGKTCEHVFSYTQLPFIYLDKYVLTRSCYAVFTVHYVLLELCIYR